MPILIMLRRCAFRRALMELRMQRALGTAAYAEYRAYRAIAAQLPSADTIYAHATRDTAPAIRLAPMVRA